MSTSFLENLIEASRRSIGEMAQLTSNNVDLATKALARKRKDGLEQVGINEEKIDQLHSHIYHSLFKILARQSPVARDLRMVLSLGRINDCLERIGDLTFSTSKDLQDYFDNPPLELVGEVARMSNLLVTMLGVGVQCFFEEDPIKANEVLILDKKVNQFRNELLVQLKEAMKLSPSLVEGGFYLISVVRKLERIGDLVTSIAEEVVFSATGNNIRHQGDPSVKSPKGFESEGAKTVESTLGQNLDNKKYIENENLSNHTPVGEKSNGTTVES